MSKEVFLNGRIHGYELRPEEGDRECESLELCLRDIEVYQLAGLTPVELEEGEVTCDDNCTL